MGSTTAPLRAFAGYCQRNPINRRPTVYVQYVDIWKQPLGEMGVPDPTDIAHACFAVLSPWAMIPTLGQAWLIVDAVDALEVTGLRVNVRGIFNPHWSVPYSMSDRGTLSFGEPETAVMPCEISSAVLAAKAARLNQAMWDQSYTLESVIPVVIGMLER